MCERSETKCAALRDEVDVFLRGRGNASAAAAGRVATATKASYSLRGELPNASASCSSSSSPSARSVAFVWDPRSCVSSSCIMRRALGDDFGPLDASRPGDASYKVASGLGSGRCCTAIAAAEVEAAKNGLGKSDMSLSWSGSVGFGLRGEDDELTRTRKGSIGRAASGLRGMGRGSYGDIAPSKGSSSPDSRGLRLS